MTLIKICGLSTKDTIKTAIDAGANMIGLVFYPPSPRNVSIALATRLRNLVPREILVVAVLVNPTDDFLQELVAKVKPDYLQLHGYESVERIKEIKEKFGIPIISAIPVADKNDLTRIPEYAAVSNMILFDAKTPKGTLPGGMGISFDWNLLKDINLNQPWMMSGGLKPDNVQAALKITQAPAVDVSSGVETQPGEKSVELIKLFIERVRKL